MIACCSCIPIFLFASSIFIPKGEFIFCETIYFINSFPGFFGRVTIYNVPPLSQKAYLKNEG